MGQGAGAGQEVDERLLIDAVAERRDDIVALACRLIGHDTTSRSDPAAPGPSSPSAAEAVPAPPGPDFVWVPGHWTWHQGVQAWVPGAWLLPPRPGYGWQPGHWMAHGTEQIWLDGYWSLR